MRWKAIVAPVVMLAAVAALAAAIFPVDVETARAPVQPWMTAAPALPPSLGAPPPSTAPTIHATVPDGWVSWAYYNRTTGQLTTGPDAATAAGRNETASMIKAWIAADYLHQHEHAPGVARLRQVTAMIRDSDNQVTETVYRSLGLDRTIARMISTCQLQSTTIVHAWWSKTTMTAADAARLGTCVGDGRAAGPRWTAHLLDEMRQVRGDGAFGIINGLPRYARAPIAYKNGWMQLDVSGDWVVNCLAIADRWVLAVLTRYPGDRGRRPGEAVCENTAAQLQQYLNDPG